MKARFLDNKIFYVYYMSTLEYIQHGGSILNGYITSLNHSKYFAGISMLLLNLGSKYIAMELSETHEQILSNKIIRRFIIFTVFFISTRDIWVSFTLTAIFIVLVTGLFNENSRYCLISKPEKKNNKYDITKEDYNNAKKIMKLYENNVKK